MHSVRAAAEVGEYSGGIAVFASLTAPTATDYRWVGACLHGEGRLLDAELRYRQAWLHGDHGAALFLASVHLARGHNTQALEALTMTSPEHLTDEDAALWWRERARAAWMLGEPRQQLLEAAQRAWVCCAAGSLNTQVSVATLLGSVHTHYAEHEQALAYLVFAAEHGHPGRQEFIALCRAESLLALRRFAEADAALATVRSLHLHPLRELLRVRMLRAQGQWQQVAGALHDLLPQVSGQDAEECRVRFGLMAIALLSGDLALAERHRQRARTLSKTPVRDAELNLLTGLLLHRHHDSDAVSHLTAARDAFHRAEIPFSVIMAYLALGEVDVAGRADHVTRAATVAASLSVLPDLTAEWRFFPAVAAYLHALPDTAFERTLLQLPCVPEEATLCTLGSGAVEYRGQRVTFRYTRAIEILSFLCRYREVTLPELQSGLFPNVPPQRSKNYFHQVRIDVALRLPGLEIAFDSRRKVYSLRGRLRLHWDVEELERSFRANPLKPLQAGSVEFLPDAEGEWASEERDKLRRWVTQVGLETMDHWFQAGEFDKCIQLAERLLPIDPLDEGLHTFLLTATYQAQGRLMALHRYHTSAATFLNEVGEIPETLQQLELSWKTLN